ncbi:MAG: membrane protein insertion efficiency factor YidD [Parachlamydiaceae bacterium]
MKTVAIGLVKLYQLCISPFIGDVCRFNPSCSNYAINVLKTHGFLKGSWMALKRIVSCNPWF